LDYNGLIEDVQPQGVDPNHKPRYTKKHPNTNSKGGRPTKFTEEFCIELGNDWLKWLQDDESRIYAGEFLAYKGIHQQRISELTRKYPTFAEIYKKANNIQQTRLVKAGLKGGNNQAAVIFLLKNLAGMADKVETKSQNANYNYDPKYLKTATVEDLQEIIRESSDAVNQEA